MHFLVKSDTVRKLVFSIRYMQIHIVLDTFYGQLNDVQTRWHERSSRQQELSN